MALVSKNAMRGLTNFISDLRSATTKEEEDKRVNKEMAKIRKKFKEADVSGYDRKKYVAKLIYMFMLGYDLDFGYMEAVSLLSSVKFQEKLIGYISLSLLLHENHEMLPLIIQSLQNDLQSRNEFHQCLALTAIANIGGKEMSESLLTNVQKILTAKFSKPTIKRKAALCLLRLYRKYPDLVSSESLLEKVIQLLDEHDLGLLTSVMGLLLGLAKDNPKPYEVATKKVIWILTKIVINRDYAKDYVYYNMANPWLQVKLLRFLSYYDPPEEPNDRARLYEILKKILGLADVAKGQTVNHKNALNAVLFEAIYLVIHLDDDRDLIHIAASLLGRFISPKEHSNIRYLALATMSHIASLDSETADLVKKHQDTVIQALRDMDISIRRRALDLLYGMCDRNNVKVIVAELLTYLNTADFSIREELVLKIAILAEKFAHNYAWYVDVILQLITVAGDAVSDDIWFRVIQIVTNHEDIQEYAAMTVFQALRQANPHESAVKVGGYILGEFGHLIVEKPKSGPMEQFEALNSKFSTCSPQTKALLLSSFIKFVNLYPELTEPVRNVFRAYQTNLDADLQQRACEYDRLTQCSEQLLQTVWDVMPPFPERNSEDGSLTTDSTEDGGANPVVSSSTATATTTTTATLIDDSPRSGTTDPPVKTAPGNLLGSSGPQNSSSSRTERYDVSKDLESLLLGTAISDTSALPPSQSSSFPLETSSPSASASSAPFQPIPESFARAPIERDSLLANGSVPLAIGSVKNFSDHFKRACMAGEGVLHQDENIQIGFKSEFNKGMGRMMLYYGNVSQQFPLMAFSTGIPSPEYLNLNLQPVVDVVGPRTQAQQLITMSTTSSNVNTYVDLHLSFSINGKPVNLHVKMPIVVPKFTEPLILSAPAFFQSWKQFETPPLSVHTIIKSPRPIDISWLSKLLSSGFRMAVLQGVDPNMNNLVAAGTFFGGPMQVVCLVRLETNSSAAMYRASVRTSNGAITNAIKDLLEIQLG